MKGGTAFTDHKTGFSMSGVIPVTDPRLRLPSNPSADPATGIKGIVYIAAMFYRHI